MNHVYVLGAGASKASANTPLGNNLVWNYYLDCMTWIPLKDNNDPDLHDENKDFKNFKKFLELCSSIYTGFDDLLKEWNNRGTEMFYLNSYDRLKKEHYIDELLEILYQKDNKKGIELVRRLIFEHLVESSFYQQNLLYKKFISDILAKRLEQNISIISFNFDFLLHEDFEKGFYFDYLIKFDLIDQYRKKIYARTNPIKLIKLNGSLDWGICPSCDTLYLYPTDMQRNFYDNKKCSKCDKSIQPFIVIPHEKHKNIIKPLWDEAEEALKCANIVTVIGYSLPKYDETVQKLFSETLKPNTKLQVVDYCQPNEDKISKEKDILQKYKDIFRSLDSSNIDIFLDGFKGYLDRLTS